jgi:AcrR family transcriptional regulator
MAMGRPREFDVDKALELALQVFWRKGYEGASMTDLTETMGITKPSLYSAFGNKEELFRKALDRYVDGPGGYVQVALAKPTVRGVVEHLLYEAADAVTDPNHPPGCLAVQGALSCGDAAESIKQELMSRRANGEQDLRKRFERAIAEGDLPAGSDADLAAYISAILQGMAVQAAGGTSRAQLRKIAEMALRTWPPTASAAA